jgi:two-component system, OmpR family, sensor kinase
MRLSDVIRGRRLLLRLYLFEAVLFTVIIVAFGAIVRFVFEPGMTSGLRSNLVWVATEILDAREHPARLHRQFETLRQETPINATLFTPQGRIVGDTARETSASLDPVTLIKLTRLGSIALSTKSVAVASVEGGQLNAYAVVSVRSPVPPLWPGLIAYGVVLITLGIGSVPLARWIARPLERLTGVTQAFGLGDLRARADTNRHDEFGDLARAFNVMADRIESLRRTEKELLANVSHELRTPLARIRVLLELAEDDVPTTAHRYLDDISDDLTELEQILANIIATARLDIASDSQNDPYPPLRLIPLSASEFVETIANKFRRHHPDRIVKTEFDCGRNISVDRLMLTHAVSNILDNAQKYSAPPTPIEICVKAEVSFVSIIVKDHGIGIGADDLPKVFTPFFRADPSRTRGTGGVGLGLAFAKRLIEAHGGSIVIESEPNRGTCVTMCLPT